MRSKGARVRDTFNQVDQVYSLSQNFATCFVWAMRHGLLLSIPMCTKCTIPYKLIKSPELSLSDGRCYMCTICEQKEQIRKNSFFNEFPGLTIMEVTRIIFYYFCRGYGVDDVVRECKGVMGDGFGDVLYRKKWASSSRKARNMSYAESARC